MNEYIIYSKTDTALICAHKWVYTAETLIEALKAFERLNPKHKVVGVRFVSSAFF